MAGGKETPRQKMIGMMYLVLTALLALNVSKSILDAFVAIEENIQVANENEFARGQEKYFDLREVSQDKTQPDLQKKAAKLMETVEKIDKITAERIKLIDDIKIEILSACGEDVTTVGTPESIIFKAYDPKSPLKPTRMHLDHVSGKDKYDEPMLVMGINEDITKPVGRGMELWESYNNFRGELTELIAGSVIVEKGQKAFFFKDPKINEWKDFPDLQVKIKKAIDAANVNMDDKEAIAKIYMGLSKLEKSEVHEVPGVHWIGKTFDHSPSVAALASLSSMQKEILTARADAVSLIRSRVGGGEYSFNKIMALAYGPEIANQGDEIEVQVLMAAYDSDKQPEVTFNGAKINEVKDGKGFVKTKAAGGAEMTLKGEITIKNKSGIPKTLPWEKNIKIMKPSGTVSLPDMAVLFRNYENVIEGAASGYDQTILTSELGLVKKGNQWICKASTGAKTGTISVSGKSSITNKTVKLGTYTFKIKNLPRADVFLGGYGGGDAPRANIAAATNLRAGYSPDGLGSLLSKASFNVTSWTVTLSGAPKSESGSGSSLSAAAMNLLRQARVGSKVTVEATYSGMGASGVRTYAVINVK